MVMVIVMITIIMIVIILIIIIIAIIIIPCIVLVPFQGRCRTIFPVKQVKKEKNSSALKCK